MRPVIGLVAGMLPWLLNTRGKQRLSILIYHRVVPEHDPMRPYEPTLEVFDWQMRLLRECFTPLPLLQALDMQQSGTLPERAVCVTFDDGYADNERHALPILQRHAIPATVFVSTGFLNGGRMWNDSVIEALRVVGGDALDLEDLELGRHELGSLEQRMHAAESVIDAIKHLDPGERMAVVSAIESRVDRLPADLMMTDEQVRSLARAGITIGAHTVNHPILASVEDDVARGEILESKHYLESLLQDEVQVFAYPNGRPELDYRARHPQMVREMGFRAAVSTHWGVSTALSDRYQLPRFTPWDRQPAKFALRLLANYRKVDPLIAGSG